MLRVPVLNIYSVDMMGHSSLQGLLEALAASGHGQVAVSLCMAMVVFPPIFF